MVAAVIEMNGTRSVEVDRLPVERRRCLLEWLAREWRDLPKEAGEVLLTAWSRRQPDLEDHWYAFQCAWAHREAVEHNIIDWDWRCSDCGHSFASECPCGCCPSAYQQAQDDADEALDVLVGCAR